MVKRIGTKNKKSRKKTTKSYRYRGKISLRKYFQELKQGERVVLRVEPAVQKGAHHLRFDGKVGIIQQKQGGCYKVRIKDHKKHKCLIVHPVHLTRLSTNVKADMPKKAVLKEKPLEVAQNA